MDRFPTVHHLAAATDDKVNSLWAGLGFYLRIRLLHQAARLLVNKTDNDDNKIISAMVRNKPRGHPNLR
jgi:adenine-specific DNA glycosylase